MFKYTQQQTARPQRGPAVTPLIFEPGTRWQYGTGMDWTGRLVEVVSGQTLEAIFSDQHLQAPGHAGHQLYCSRGKIRSPGERYSRASDGSLKEDPRILPATPEIFQRRRRTFFNGRRLRAIHADDSAARGRAPAKNAAAGQDGGDDGDQPDRRTGRRKTENVSAQHVERCGPASRRYR